MTHHDKARELVQRLKVVARCGTDSTMRHSAYAFMAQDPDGYYVTYSAYAAQAEENRRLREALSLTKRADDLREVYHSLPNDRNRIGDKRSRKSHARDAWLRAFRKAAKAARAALSSTGEK